jgi:tetratricopeptide (TPR) repeat protein
LLSHGTATNLEDYTKVTRIDSQGGINFAKHGNIPKGLEYLRKAISVEPTNPGHWTNIGLFYEMDKQPEEAYASFKQAIALDSTSMKAWAGLARYQQAKGRPSSEICNTLSKFNPTLGIHLNQVSSHTKFDAYLTAMQWTTV